MNTQDLNRALAGLASRPAPALPASLEQNVWREIRARKTPPAQESIWDTLTAMLLRPAWVSAATVVAVLVSVSFSAVEASRVSYASGEPLNLTVFSVEAPSLPSTLIARAR